MTIPTTPLKFPMQGKPVDENGYWTPIWSHALQGLFKRVGADVSPSNAQLAAAIGTGVTGPGTSTDNAIVVFSGTTGTSIKDSAVLLTSLATTSQVSLKANIASPSFTGTVTAVNVTFSGLAITAASSLGSAGLRLPPGIAPTTPSNGDLWTTTSGVFARIAGTTVGPFGAAAWGSITGTLSSQTDLQTILNLLAPLASPAFTGTATAVNVTFSGLALTAASATGSAGIRVPHGVAPTAPVNGDFWSTTSGFFGRVSGATIGPFGVSGSGASSSFSAHNNGTAQSIPNSTFTKLTFSTAVYNVGANFASSTWTPPTGKPVVIVAAAALLGATNTLFTVAIYKNGVEYKRGTMVTAPSSTTEVVTVTAQDMPNGTDIYEAWVFQSTGAAVNTIGTSSLTYFQGTTVTP